MRHSVPYFEASLEYCQHHSIFARSSVERLEWVKRYQILKLGRLQVLSHLFGGSNLTLPLFHVHDLRQFDPASLVAYCLAFETFRLDQTFRQHYLYFEAIPKHKINPSIFVLCFFYLYLYQRLEEFLHLIDNQLHQYVHAASNQKRLRCPWLCH